nr:hypothetical protein CFP56_33481 [Quercus suber]
MTNDYPTLPSNTYGVQPDGGWPQASSPTGNSPCWAVEQLRPSDSRLLEAFLQSWIFFALLRSIFDPWHLFDIGEYVENDGAGKVGAMLAVRSHSSPAFSKPLHQSLLAVSELVETTNNTVYNDFTIAVTASSVDSRDLDNATLLQNGWCPAEIAQTLSEPKRYSQNCYLQNLKKLSLGIDHTSCSRDVCAQLQINLDIYKPAHLKTVCDCGYGGPDLEQVQKILHDGTFLVLKIVTAGIDGMELEVQPYQNGMAFVALCHVWIQTYKRWADAARETEIEVTETRTLSARSCSSEPGLSMSVSALDVPRSRAGGTALVQFRG